MGLRKRPVRTGIVKEDKQVVQRFIDCRSGRHSHSPAAHSAGGPEKAGPGDGSGSTDPHNHTVDR